jgi:beta-mannanase
MLAARMDLARSKGRTLMVTVEPYTKAENWRDDGDRLFSDIRSGGFDRQIEAVCSAVAAYPAASWIRWGHEMEQPSERYPWARGDASGYIGAYRYFVDACRKVAPRARFVWSPKGEHQLADYYPGDDYVDLIGLSVWGLESLDWNQYHKPRSFADTFNDKYRRVEKFGKPVIIAELGVAGTRSYRRAWMMEISALSSGSAPFPLLAGAVYFNDREPYHWPNGYGSPDWRMTALELAP